MVLAGPSSTPPQYTVLNPEYDAQAIVANNSISYVNEQGIFVNPRAEDPGRRNREDTRDPRVTPQGTGMGSMGSY